MRILLVGDYPNDPRLGSAKVPHKLAEELRALGHHCDLLFAEELGRWPAAMHARHAIGPWLAERAVARAFRRQGPYDVVDIASGEGLLFGLKRRLGAYPGVAFISRSHGLEHRNYQRMLDDHRAGMLHKPWQRRLWYPLVRLNQVAAAARLADRLLVLNPMDRDFALARGWKRPHKVATVGHGVSERFLSAAPPPDAPRGAGILFCGTWTGVKGVDYLVPAFVRLIESGSRANLTILGGALPVTAIRAAFPSHVQDHLTVIDRLAEERVMEQYRRHDVLAFCSTYEGFGMVVPEAMSQRLPVVATPVGCVPELVRDGETGMLVPPRDPAALAVALGDLLANAGLRGQLADRAYLQVGARTWAETARRTVEMYTAALATTSHKLMATSH